MTKNKPISKLAQRHLRGALKRLGGYAAVAKASRLNIQTVWRMVNDASFFKGKKKKTKERPTFRPKTHTLLAKFFAKEKTRRGK